jgi:hypothetical protein
MSVPPLGMNFSYMNEPLVRSVTWSDTKADERSFVFRKICWQPPPADAGK